MSTGHENLHDFFSCCERLLNGAAKLAPFSDEDRKRICFYTNEIAKLTDSQRLSSRTNGNASQLHRAMATSSARYRYVRK